MGQGHPSKKVVFACKKLLRMTGCCKDFFHGKGNFMNMVISPNCNNVYNDTLISEVQNR